MEYIEIYDYILLLLYLSLFYFLITLKSKQIEHTGLKRYFITAFFLHMVGSFIYCMVIRYYYGYGDSFVFFQGSTAIRRIIEQTGNPFNVFFTSPDDFLKNYGSIGDSDINIPPGMDIGSNLIIMKISAILSYISFNSYMVVSSFFGLFSFLGTWKLFSVFNEITHKKGEKLFAISILYLPSIWFWGSGLMKESVCMGALGLIVFYIYKIFIKGKFRATDPIILLLVFYLLFIVKNYLAIVLLISMVLGYIISLLAKSKSNPAKFFTILFLLFISGAVFIISSSATLNSIIEDSKANIETFKTAYENAVNDDERSLAGFTGVTISESPVDIILESPIAVFTSLFRPFLWETKKALMFLSAIESLLTLLATLFVFVKCRGLKFFLYIFTEPYLFFCFIYTILLGAIIGFSTFNFGTLVRYRLPILPFYFFMLLFIYLKTIKLNRPHETNSVL